MPSSTVKQAKVMSALAHGWHPSKGSVAKIPVSVAEDFHAADAGHKYGKGHDKKKKRADGGAALNLAYAMKRERADGGRVHEGPIISAVPGRTDKHEMNVAHGAYVLPAHVISGLGQGNTLAGMEKAKQMFPDIHEARRTHGGQVPQRAVPVITAGGEMVISPEQIIAKYGSLEKGHKALDRFCKQYTKKLAKQISKLPGPARD